MSGIWLRLVRKNRIEKDLVLECARDDWKEALEEGAHRLDAPRPLVLHKHERDFEEFSQTRFLRDHFMEDVPFDRMEVEWIDPDRKKKVNEKYL